MPKFTKLERRVIRAAYATHAGSEERRVLREVLAHHFKTEKEWETYKEKHPDTEEENHTFEFKGDENPDKKDEEDEDRNEEVDNSDEDDIGSAAESEKLQKAKELASKAFKKGWKETKAKMSELKGKFDKLKSDVKEDRSETFGEIAEMMTAMMTAVFTSDSAFLDSVMGRIEAKKEDREKVQNAIAMMKAAELAAIADEELAETMLDNGVDVLSDTEKEELEGYGKLLRGEIEDDSELEESLRQTLFDRFTDMGDERIALLKDFVSEGVFDVDKAKDFFVRSFQAPTTSPSDSDEDS